MIISPSRLFPIVDKNGKPDDRFAAWAEQVTRHLGLSFLVALSQIIDTSRGDAELTYTNGVLTLITYGDASTKEFNYTDGVLTQIVDSAGTTIDFTIENGELSLIEVA